MFKWLKRHFIPHEGNGHRPHLLHRKNIKHLLGVVVAVELILFVVPSVKFVALVDTFNLGAVLPSVLTELTNTERQSNKLPTLVESPLLDKVAQMKAEDMASKSYFAHTSPEGKTPWYWFDKAGYVYRYAGENLAVNFSDSQEVTKAWMNSPTHRANIVGGMYKEVGTGVATGMYKGREAVFVAQVYAEPVPAFMRPKAGNQQPTTNNPQLNSKSVTLPNAGPASVQETSLWQKIISSPRQATDVTLFVILGIVLVAVLLHIFLRVNFRHLDLALNGLALIAIILAIHLGNNFISSRNLETSYLTLPPPPAESML
ncbi:CAP domain-containing protein [Candidatus Parcubacteria bacterium]|nr:CAP domain-containing protein [Candidatus Parcubacteria bacterium]